MGTVVRASAWSELSLIRLPEVHAVIFQPPELPAWMSRLGECVERGDYRVPRTFIRDADRDTIAHELEDGLPGEGLPRSVRASLIDDILFLVDTCRELSSSGRFQVRYLTNSPNPECGYHVDTVPAGAPTEGLLRVYCGTGTEYPDPDNVKSVAEFYRYVYERERLTKKLVEADKRGEPDLRRRVLEQRALLDARPRFLRRPDCVQVIEAGSVVAMKYESSEVLWGDHLSERRAAGWIHRSPMEGGKPRFLVNINPY